MLSTLAMFVTGVAVLVLLARQRAADRPGVNVRVLGRDVVFFVVGYAIAIGTAFVPAELVWVRWVCRGVLLILYAIYVRAHFRDEPEEAEPDALNRLHATRLPGMARTAHAGHRHAAARAGQLGVDGAAPDADHRRPGGTCALALIILGAQVFVGAVEHLSTRIGLDPRSWR